MTILSNPDFWFFAIGAAIVNALGIMSTRAKCTVRALIVEELIDNSVVRNRKFAIDNYAEMLTVRGELITTLDDVRASLTALEADDLNLMPEAAREQRLIILAKVRGQLEGGEEQLKIIDADLTEMKEIRDQAQQAFVDRFSQPCR